MQRRRGDERCLPGVSGGAETFLTRAACALVTAAWVLATPAGFVHAQNLVYNADFEMPAPENPPPGWTMWGARQYKNPANYTRDTDNPHGGDACFRMYHPKNTAGYIVSSPQHALRPKKGMAYDVSFWARTDKPGPAVFYFEAYSSISPFRDAPSTGRFPYEPQREWKQFRFRVHEGMDFRADQCRYLLLTFRVAMDRRTERTLWIDDVVVTERKSTMSANLLELGKLEYEPLEHRLRPGTELAFTVDARKHVREATRCAAGISFHRVAGWTRQPYDREGNYRLVPELERAVRDLHLPMTRFYAVGAEQFSLESSIDKVVEILTRADIPQETTVLEFEIQSASSKLPPEVWARGVKHALDRGYRFRFWEVSNEPYTRKSTAFFGPDDYTDHVKEVAEAIRAVQPEAQIGIGIHGSSLRWGNYVLKRAAGYYDFVVGHYYAGPKVYERKFEAVVLTENYKKLDHILRINALIRAYNPDREVYQYDTEWGLHSASRTGDRADYADRNANIVGSLHRAVRLIYYIRENILRGASSWEMFCRLKSQGFGILTPDRPKARSYIYWVYYYFNRHVGKWVLPTDGTAPWLALGKDDDMLVSAGESSGPLTPVLVTASADGKKLYFVIVNGSWTRDVPCAATVRGFRARRAEGVVISNDDLDGKPIFENKEDAVGTLPVKVSRRAVRFNVPAHSVVFITVEGNTR